MMTSSKKKQYFAQSSTLGVGHRAKYFDDLGEARNWLLHQGGGTIKKRNFHLIDDGINAPYRVWGEIETVSSQPSRTDT